MRGVANSRAALATAACSAAPARPARLTPLQCGVPGKPTHNALVEAFNGRFRVECLNAYWFLSLADARKKMESWRGYHNEERARVVIGVGPPNTTVKHDGVAAAPM